MNKPISFKDKRELVDALLNCGTVANRGARDKMVDQLRADIKSTIHRDETAKHDVMEIVTRCLDFDGGLDEFVDIVRFYEGASRNMAAVDALIDRLTGENVQPVHTAFSVTAPVCSDAVRRFQQRPHGRTTNAGESVPDGKGVRVFLSHADILAKKENTVGPENTQSPLSAYADDVFCLSVVVRDYGNAVYRLYLRDRITLGNLRDSGADVRIGSKGVKRGHGYVERRGDLFYLVSQNGECRIMGASENTPLKAGHEIRIGAFTMTVVSVSDRALVLDMPDPNPVDYKIRGFILMKNRLVIGPNKDADIRIPALKATISLIEKDRRFSAETGQENTAVDFGKPADIGGAGIFLGREPGKIGNFK